MREFKLQINGEERCFYADECDTLLTVLRETLDMTDTKCGCSAGECGACTVIVNGVAVRSCLVRMKQVNEASVETVKGLACGEEIHPIQQAFVDVGAIQCGFCTPGMIMSAKALLDRNINPVEAEVRRAIDTNLCRCTGYDKIVEAILLAARRMRGGSL